MQNTELKVAPTPAVTSAPAPARVPRRQRKAWLKDSPKVTALKWGFMSAALFWLAVYRLSQSAERLPDFVYVNF